MQPQHPRPCTQQHPWSHWGLSPPVGLRAAPCWSSAPCWWHLERARASPRSAAGGSQSQQHSYTSPRVSPWRFPHAPAPKRLQAGVVSSRSQTPRTWLEIKQLPTWLSKATGVVLRAGAASPSTRPPLLVPLKLLRFHVSFRAPSLHQQDRPAKAKIRIKTSLGCSGAKPAHGLAALSKGRMGTAARWQNWYPQCPVLVMLAPARCLHM